MIVLGVQPEDLYLFGLATRWHYIHSQCLKGFSGGYSRNCHGLGIISGSQLKGAGSVRICGQARDSFGPLPHYKVLKTVLEVIAPPAVNNKRSQC
jgi:hypothetical protein